MPFLNKEKYSEYESWNKFIEQNKNLNSIGYDKSWSIMFSYLNSDGKLDKIQKKIENYIEDNKKNNKNKKPIIAPYPDLLFTSFNLTKADDLKVVILGQDPYFNCDMYNNKNIPQAMGLSFSIPEDFKIPSSLNNIFKNMIKFGHIDSVPENGDLSLLAVQGCLMLNTSLTVEIGKPNSHKKIWSSYTNNIIEYISNYMDNIIFVLWGAEACKKLELIDLEKHHTIISSHPSGHSCHKKYREYPAFNDEDHFGKINMILKSLNKKEIVWNL